MRTLHLWTKALLFCLLAGVIDTPVAYGEPDSIQSLLASNLEAYERLAAPMDPELQQDALGMREALLATTRSGFADHLGEQAARDLKAALHRQGEILARIEARTPPTAAKSENSATAADSDWPDADCTVISESSISWSIYLDYLDSTNAAAEAWKLGQPLCKKIEILPISIDDPFVFENPDTCAIEVEECAMEVEGAPFGEGIIASGGVGGSAVLTPATLTTCTGLSTAIAVAQKAQSLMSAYLGCWDQAKTIANNGRLTVVREEVQKLQGKIDVLKRLVVEGSLNVRGGTRLSAMYLPEEYGGALEVVRDYTKTAFTQTAAAGYRMKPDIQPMLNSADAALEAGEYKKAFNLYRGAYRHITVKSREGLR
jgi:hypothetical protein